MRTKGRTKMKKKKRNAEKENNEDVLSEHAQRNEDV